MNNQETIRSVHDQEKEEEEEEEVMVEEVFV